MIIKTLIAFIFLGINSFFGPGGDGNDAKPLTVVYPNAEIKVMQNQNKFNVDVAKGSKLVFYIDDINLGKVYFQISSDRRFFRYTDGSMKNVDLMILKGQDLLVPDSGEVNGFKLAENIWKIDLILNKGGDKYTFSRRFHIEDQLATAYN